MASEEPSVEAAPAGNRRRRLIRRALVAALVFHVVLLAVLVAVKNPFWANSSASTAANSSSEGSSTDGSSESGKPAPPTPPNVIDDSPQWKPQVESRIAESIQQAEKLTPEEQKQNLQEQVAKLDQLSSQESVEQMAAQLKKFLGAEERATEPATEPVEGEFDFDTAQIHDVERRKAEDGSWEYVQVLLDGKGRTLEVKMGTAEGERLYEVMQTVKQSPLAATIYKQVVMPTLDKLLKAQRDAQKAKKSSSPPPRPAPAQDLPVGDASEG